MNAESVGFRNRIRCRNLTILGIILIIAGIGILGYKGMPLVIDPTQNMENNTKDIIHTIQLNKVTSIDLIDKSPNPPLQYAKLDFDTITVFAGDSVRVRANAYQVAPNVVGIVIITTDPSENFTDYTGQQVEKEIRIDQAFDQTVILSPKTDPPFQSVSILKFLQPNQQVAFHGFVFLNNGSFGQLETSRSAFSVLPITDKLQAETSYAELQQINETRKATLSQDIYNNIVLGLTWLGVGAIPVLVGADILLRIYVGE